MSDLSNAPTRELVEALISLLNGAIATSAQGFNQEALDDAAETLTDWFPSCRVEVVDGRLRVVRP
jgi:hypothetical protein